MADEPNITDRFLAIVLMAGGALGACLFVFLGGRFLYQLNPSVLGRQWVYAVPLALLLWLFVWSVIVGVRFWRRESRGWKWATILFAMQIPILTVPGLSYTYYTGLAIALVGGRVAKPFSLEFGSQASVWLDPRINDLVYAINLFALAAAVYLFRRRRAYADAARTAVRPDY